VSDSTPSPLAAALNDLVRQYDADWDDVLAAVDAMRQDSASGVADPAELPAVSFARAVAVQWQELLEKLPLIALGLDRRGDVLFANQHLYTVTGLTAEEVIGHHWFEHFLPEEDRVDVREAFGEILDKEFHRSYENHIVDASGRERLIRWFNVRLTTPEGRVAGTFSLGHELPELTASPSGRDPGRSEQETDNALVSVCAWCSQVQTDEGQWVSVAQILTDLLGAQVSHGLCPGCFGYLAEGQDRRGS
jgi:PAS domain S-box-containing protein